MTRNFVTFLKGATLAGAIAVYFMTGSAWAQIVIVPPAACLATVSPVYYEGYASYWCGDSWYYRNGASWGLYGSEPAYLRSYRSGHAPAPQLYGRGRPGGGARAGGGRSFGGGARVGGGGGHAGGGGHR